MTRLRRRNGGAASAGQVPLRRRKVRAAAAGQHRAIVLLARAPSAAGKTRLTADLTADQARTLRAALLLDTLEVARSIGVPVAVWYTPADAREEMSALVAGPEGGRVALAPQQDGDLGARMHHAIIETLASGADSVVLIGSDLPTLPPAHISDAFTQLESGVDCTFGPTEDGGYYLIGIRANRKNESSTARIARVFGTIPWGSDGVLRASLAAAKNAGLSSALVDQWFDVDSPADLARVGREGSKACRTSQCATWRSARR